MPKFKNPNRSQDTGLLPHQDEFLDWLTDPERQGSQNEWARSRGLAGQTVSAWKRDDPFFQDALRRRMAERNLDPESIQDILDALKKEAKGGNVQAAKYLLDYIRYLQPTPPTVDISRPAEEMTDEELAAALRAEATRLEGGSAEPAPGVVGSGAVDVGEPLGVTPRQALVGLAGDVQPDGDDDGDRHQSDPEPGEPVDSQHGDPLVLPTGMVPAVPNVDYGWRG